jgi:hypothetical protein
LRLHAKRRFVEKFSQARQKRFAVPIVRTTMEDGVRPSLDEVEKRRATGSLLHQE